MINAAIDIGTNTMLLLVAEVEPNSAGNKLQEIRTVLEDHIQFVRLGQGVNQNRRFLPEAEERSLKCFREFKVICDKNNVDNVFAIATSASRDAQNAVEFYKRAIERFCL